MKLGVVSDSDKSTVALRANGRWIDFSRAYRFFQLVELSLVGTPLDSLGDLVRTTGLEPSIFDRVLALLDSHNLFDTYTIPEPAHFQLPFRPGKIVAIGRNYAKHAAETGHDVPKEPLFFSKSPSACIGPEEAIIVKEWYGRVDHEAELAVIIGKRCKEVSPDAAMSHIAGYTLLNDVTARELQQQDIASGHPWFRSKSIDTFCPFGPVVALPDEMPTPLEVDIELRVNGEVRQKSNTGLFIYTVADLIAYVSKFITLEPGDVIATGTPEGISPIRPGDRVEVTVPQIGSLANPVSGP